jgi:hypothetical protein
MLEKNHLNLFLPEIETFWFIRSLDFSNIYLGESSKYVKCPKFIGNYEQSEAFAAFV